MTQIKKMSLKDFHELGYIQELNRQFLHPRGLALSIEKDTTTGEVTENYIEIFDARDDVEGYSFVNLDPEVASEKAEVVEAEYKKHLKARNKLWKTRKGIQPLEDATESKST